jgi:hypothetical protein
MQLIAQSIDLETLKKRNNNRTHKSYSEVKKNRGLDEDEKN